MPNYRERIVRRAARTAARQTMLLQRVNTAFGETPAAEERSESFYEIAARLDRINNIQSVRQQQEAMAIVDSIPSTIQRIQSDMSGGQ